MSSSQENDVFGLEGVASETARAEAESKWLLQHFKLPYNPFPPSGISPDVPEAPPLKDEQGQQIAPLVGNFILNAYRNRAATQGLVIIGTYGTGKTHLLRLIYKEINERLGSGEERAIAIYVDRPRVEVQDLNREILRSLGEDTIRKWMWFSLRSELARDISNHAPILDTLRQSLQGPLFAYRMPASTSDAFDQVFHLENLEDYREFLQAYDKQGWRREHLREYFGELLNRVLRPRSPLEVVEAFVALLLAPDEKTRTSWESLLALGQKRRVPLMGAPEFLSDLLKLIQLNGYVYTFLLIDEFEEVPAGTLLSSRQKADYMYTLMETINKVTNGLGLVLAITSPAWQLLVEQAQPLQSRLPRVIRLGDLDGQSIRSMLIFYQNKARSDGQIQVEDSLFPFSQKDVDEIATRMPERTPRNIVQFASQVITYCFSNDKTIIEPDTIRTVLEDFLAAKNLEAQKKRHLKGS